MTRTGCCRLRRHHPLRRVSISNFNFQLFYDDAAKCILHRTSEVAMIFSSDRLAPLQVVLSCPTFVMTAEADASKAARPRTMSHTSTEGDSTTGDGGKTPDGLRENTANASDSSFASRSQSKSASCGHRAHVETADFGAISSRH